MKTTACGVGGRVSKLRRAWPTIMLLAFAIGCASAYADDTKPNFVFVDGTGVTLSPDSSGAFKLDIALKNSGGQEGEASLNLVGVVDSGCDETEIVKPKTVIRLPPNAVAITQFEIVNVKLPATCYIKLVTAGESGSTSLKQIKLTQQYATCIVLLSLGGCLVISGLVAVYTWRKADQRLNFKLGSPAWDFTKSWSSNTALAGAVISTALALSALPELTKYASKSGYSALALLISFAVIIAPFVFIAFRTGDIGNDTETETHAVVYQGPLWLFLLSCAITLFTALAQLAVLLLLLHEIFREYESLWLIAAAFASTIVLIVGLCRYVRDSMLLTIKLQVANTETLEKAKEEVIAKAREKAQQEGNTFHDEQEPMKAKIMAIEAAKARPPSWPVL